jgi:hypothetical protein
VVFVVVLLVVGLPVTGTVCTADTDVLVLGSDMVSEPHSN